MIISNYVHVFENLLYTFKFNLLSSIIMILCKSLKKKFGALLKKKSTENYKRFLNLPKLYKCFFSRIPNGTC